MPLACCALGCGSRHQTGSGVTFHRIPNTGDQRDKWLRAIKRGKVWNPSRTTVLCSKHFKREDFEQRNGRCFLRIGAVPSIFDYVAQSHQHGLQKRSSKGKKSKGLEIESVCSVEEVIQESNSEERSTELPDSPEKLTSPEEPTSVAEGSVRCPLCCGEHLVSRPSLKSHLQWVQAHLQCPVCHQMFREVSAVADHLDVHIKGEDKVHQPTIDVPNQVKSEEAQVFTFFFTSNNDVKAGTGQDKQEKEQATQAKEPEVAWCLVEEKRSSKQVQMDTDSSTDSSSDMEYIECVSCLVCGDEFVTDDDLKKHHIISQSCAPNKAVT